MNQGKQSEWQKARELLATGNLDAASIIHHDLTTREETRALGWMGLSDVALRRQQFRDAVVATRSAVSFLILDQRWDLIAHVAARLLSLGEYRLTIDLLRSMPWNHPGVLQHAAGLAQYLGLCDQHLTALAFVDQALQTRAFDADLLYERAMALRHLGRLGEATEAYERCLRVAPGHARAHWSLAYHAPSNPRGSRIDRLNKILPGLQPGSPDAISLHYALYREYEDAGDLSAAWKSLSLGAKMKRTGLRYDGRVEEQKYRRLMEASRLMPFPGKAPKTNSSHCPIFIVGLPRSGTTLLERALANHSQVKAAGELGDFHIQLCNETNRVARDIPDEQLLAASNSLNVQGLGQRYLERTKWRAEDHPFLVDKFPANIVYAGLIHRALPQARIICMLRNPLDSCFSGFKQLFAGGSYPHSYDLNEMVDHYMRFKRLLAHWDECMPGVVLTVSYEHFVSQPVAAMREVFSHCGLPAEDGCTDIVRNQSPSSTASSSQVREPIHDRYIGSWHRYRLQLIPIIERLEREFGHPIE